MTLGGTTLYGLTEYGGNGHGTVFSVNTNGTNYKTLLSFTGTGGVASGGYPGDGLILSGTSLFGMTQEGGVGGYGNVFSVGTNGTNYHDILSFTGTGGASPGASPLGTLLLTGTTFFGMTADGGPDRVGNIFSVGIDGSDYQDLYDFTAGIDGGYPAGGLTLSDGTLFGMTSSGGPNGDGTVFALSLNATPEPSTLALCAAGAIGLIGYGWRRRRLARTAKPTSSPRIRPPASAARRAA